MGKHMQLNYGSHRKTQIQFKSIREREGFFYDVLMTIPTHIFTYNAYKFPSSIIFCYSPIRDNANNDVFKQGWNKLWRLKFAILTHVLTEPLAIGITDICYLSASENLAWSLIYSKNLKNCQI